MTSLLPLNSTPLELAIEGAATRDVPVPVGDLWNPWACPANVLPWLAWALSVDDWDADWPENVKREVIATSMTIHRRKGTVWALRRALEAAGYGDAIITEASSLTRIGRTRPLGHSWRIGVNGTRWADYWVDVTRPITRRAANSLRATLTSIAPARCRLRGISVERIQYRLGRAEWPLGIEIAIGATYKEILTSG